MSQKVVALNSINIDDVVELKQVKKVPVDGVITNQSGSFDESSLTGELPVFKKSGDTIKWNNK